MAPRAWQETRSEALTERVVAAAANVLEAGRPLTFREVALESGVAERTIYRHFPTRTDLLTALFHWANRRMGFDGARPTDRAGAVALVRDAFPGFDALAPVVGELLTSGEGRAVRLADRDERQAAALELVRGEAPALDPERTRRVAMIVQLLMTASTWQAVRDAWDVDGAEAAEAAALAIALLLDGARAMPGPTERTTT
jgi:AcrR family transcriptional regulator